MNDLISRQAAIDAINRLDIPEDMCVFEILSHIELELGTLPPAQPEPAIPLSWIEGQIGWLKGLDNEFATLTAEQILAMMNKWKDEQNERFNQQTGGDRYTSRQKVRKHERNFRNENA